MGKSTYSGSLPARVGTTPAWRGRDSLLAAVATTITVVILAALGRDLLTAYGTPAWNSYAGVDFTLYRDAARDWLAGSPFYLPHQVAGPYTVGTGDRLYPPTTLLLFVPFTVLPAALWWLIPAGIVAYVTWRLRPGPAAWPLMAFCLWWPTTSLKVLTGNPVIWAVAALSLGTLYRWPAIFAALKLTLAPFALFGIRRRSWWVALAGLLVVSAFFAPMWPDYMRALLNSRNGDGLLYSFGEAPMMLFPLAAWAGRTR